MWEENGAIFFIQNKYKNNGKTATNGKYTNNHFICNEWTLANNEARLVPFS